MRLDAVGENLVERALAHTNVGPWPILHTQIAYTLARVIMAATRRGVYEALDDNPVPAAEVARKCSTDPRATEKLLFAPDEPERRRPDSGIARVPLRLDQPIGHMDPTQEMAAWQRAAGMQPKRPMPFP